MVALEGQGHQETSGGTGSTEVSDPTSCQSEPVDSRSASDRARAAGVPAGLVFGRTAATRV